MNLFLLTDTAAAPAQQPTNYWMLALYLVFFGALMYFLIFLPQKKREKKTKQMLETLEVGKTITTIGGMVGKVINIQDDEVTIESGIERTVVKFKKWAIKDIEVPPTDAITK
jgi:preprotein translocase subunit YajC